MCNILIVEDVDLIAKDLQENIKARGHDSVWIAESVKEAESIAVNNKINLSFVDLYLNGKLEGLKLAKMLHNEYNSNIVFVTAYPKEDINMDFNYKYINKPYSDKAIEEVLTENEVIGETA